MLRLFVYGTLKRGGRYHRQYCQGLKEAREATVVGRLFLLPQGYPMLVTPPQSILAAATGNPLADLRIQEKWTKRLTVETARPLITSSGREEAAVTWAPIHGEVFAIDEKNTLLAEIDRLEGFRPGAPSDYHRMLVMPEPASIGPVWTYIAPDGKLPPGATFIPEACWDSK